MGRPLYSVEDPHPKRAERPPSAFLITITRPLASTSRNPSDCSAFTIRQTKRSSPSLSIETDAGTHVAPAPGRSDARHDSAAALRRACCLVALWSATPSHDGVSPAAAVSSLSRSVRRRRVSTTRKSVESGLPDHAWRPSVELSRSRRVPSSITTIVPAWSTTTSKEVVSSGAWRGTGVSRTAMAAPADFSSSPPCPARRRPRVRTCAFPVLISATRIWTAWLAPPWRFKCPRRPALHPLGMAREPCCLLGTSHFLWNGA
mmetsp:Transcript_29208/g.93343  ORF Transcript_29208/g.93343 Transcript_29208/m.93343 type:complete len:260 (+) Transcript_29208:3290-4069(+)